MSWGKVIVDMVDIINFIDSLSFAECLSALTLGRFGFSNHGVLSNLFPDIHDLPYLGRTHIDVKVFG